MSAALRAEDRIDVAGRVDAVLRFGDAEPSIELMNLSRSGAALRADIPIGAVLDCAELRMRGDDAAPWVSCTCQVRYIIGENRPSGQPVWLHGVRFLEPDEGVRTFIDGVLQAGHG